MGIGLSNGAFYEDDFMHSMNRPVPQPEVLDRDGDTRDNNIYTLEGDMNQKKSTDAPIEISDHTGFRSGSNIEDRRDQTYSLSQQWNDGAGGELFRNALGMSKVYQEEVPTTSLAVQLGKEDISNDPNFKPKNNIFDYIMQDIGSATKTVQGMAKAIKDVHRGYTDNFDTILTTPEEMEFQRWKDKYAPKDSGEDYDLRGAFKEGLTPDEKSGHWSDKYKKPNHETFSDQSKYAKDRPDLAGKWDKYDKYIPPEVK